MKPSPPPRLAAKGGCVKSIFRKMDRSLRKAQKKLLKYLGFKLFNFIEPYMDGMIEPEYVENYELYPCRNTGNTCSE